MLSSANVSAGQASKYYEKDDYYSKDLEGVSIGCQWYGQGAQALGLAGEVTPEVFKQLLEGKAPNGESLHAKPIDLEKHRAGTDFTFSAPKSASIAGLVQRDERVIQAHDRAVQTALNVMESRYAQARIWNPIEKCQERTSTGNLIVATFRHETSRNQDAQLHTHAVVINASQLKDKSWRALSNEEILNNKKLLGEVYQNELAHELRQAGHEIEPRENGQFDLKGYSKEILDTFSTRRQAIETYVAQSTQPHTPQLYERANLQTRSQKKVVPRELLVGSWQGVVHEQGLALPSLPKGLERDLTLAGRDQATIAASAGIAHAEEREAVFRRGKVEQFALEHHLGQQSWDQLQAAIAQTNQLVKVDPQSDRWTTQHAIQRELDTIRLLQQGQGKVEPIATVEDIAAIAPQSLTRGQRTALEMSAVSTDRVIGWQGVAGAGKSYALNLFRQLAEDKGYEVKGFAPSAESAKTLEVEAGVSSDTVASLLCSQHDPEAASKRQIWFVDEAGLLGAEDAHTLLLRATQEQARLVLIGDTKQLSGVAAGSPFKSLQAGGMQTAKLEESLRQKQAELKAAVDAFARGDISSSFRHLFENNLVRELQSSEDRQSAIAGDYLTLSPKQRERTLILANTNAERQAITQGIRSGLQSEGSLSEDRFTLSSLKTKNLTTAQAQYAKNYAPGDVLVPTQTYKKQGLAKGQQYEVVAIVPDRNCLTVKARDGQQFDLDPSRCEKKSIYEAQLIPLASGDRLKWTRNDRDKGIRNGQELQVDAIDGQGQAIVSYNDGRKGWVDLSGQQFADYSLVATTFSAQGKTADRVLAALDKSTGKEAFYVAISRAQHQLAVYTTDAAELRQLAEQSKANKNPSDFLTLFTYHPLKNAQNQTRKPETPDRNPLHPDDSADRGHSIGSRAGDRVGDRLAATLSANNEPAEAAHRAAEAARRTADATRTTTTTIRELNFSPPASSNKNDDLGNADKVLDQIHEGAEDREPGSRKTTARQNHIHSADCTGRGTGLAERIAAGNRRDTASRHQSHERGDRSGRSVVWAESGRPANSTAGAEDQGVGGYPVQIDRRLQQIDGQLKCLSRQRNELRQQQSQQQRAIQDGLAEQILPTAIQLFEYFASTGEPAYQYPNSPEHCYDLEHDGILYTVSRDDTTNTYNVRREDTNLDLQARQDMTPQDAANWALIQLWLDQQLLEAGSEEEREANSGQKAFSEPLTLQDSVTLSVQEWVNLPPIQQITLVEAATAHRQTEPVVTIQVEQWVGQEAQLKRQMKELNDRFKEELATVKELEARGQRSLLNPFGASAEQIESAQDAAQTTQRSWKSHKRDCDQIQARRSQRHRQEVEHEAWTAHPDTQGARRIREILQDTELRSQYQEVAYTADQLKQWETKVARWVGRGDDDLEQIHLLRQHYLDSEELSDSYCAAMEEDLQKYYQAQKSQQRGWQL